MVYKFFDKRSSAGGIKSQNISNNELAEEILKQVIRTFEKRKVHSPFIGNILGAVKQLISKFNEEFKFFLCVIENENFARCSENEYEKMLLEYQCFQECYSNLSNEKSLAFY